MKERPTIHDLEELAQARWKGNPTCPWCGFWKVKPNKTRSGHTVYTCNDCGRPFLPITNTYMEDSRVPLRKWLIAYHLELQGGTSAREVSYECDVASSTAMKMLRAIRRGISYNTFDKPKDY